MRYLISGAVLAHTGSFADGCEEKQIRRSLGSACLPGRAVAAKLPSSRREGVMSVGIAVEGLVYPHRHTIKALAHVGVNSVR